MAFSENYGGHAINVESQQTMNISYNFCLSKLLRNTTIGVFLIAKKSRKYITHFLYWLCYSHPSTSKVVMPLPFNICEWNRDIIINSYEQLYTSATSLKASMTDAEYFWWWSWLPKLIKMWISICQLETFVYFISWFGWVFGTWYKPTRIFDIKNPPTLYIFKHNLT